MPTVLVATTNPGKLREYRRLFEGVPGAKVVSPNEIEVWVEVAETGDTFEANALLKARAFHGALPDELRAEGVWVLGDDSGLEVDAMGGGPGVLSNRWAGPDTTAQQRNEALLARLEGVPDPERTRPFQVCNRSYQPHGRRTYSGRGC